MADIKIITKHWDKINPQKIDDYLAVGGYEALRKIVWSGKLDGFISEIKKSGLKGRGGAGYSSGEKLEIVAGQTGEKYFICNLDESEPGTYKDRMIVEKNPHQLLEGIIILSILAGAKKAFIYINGNYEKSGNILEDALEQSKEGKFWGKNILGTPYDLEIEIFSGAGAYVCGEETALINSIEGNRGEPKARPPYPTDSGLFGQPTLVNNAETISNIAWIITNGGEAYFNIGSSESPGTKLFILGGSVKKQGVFEVLTGITIRELINVIGGGMPRGKEFWFAQIGGASGKLFLESELDAPMDFNLPMGSGAVLVVDKSVNIYDLILSWTGFFRRESCGKCMPCREGTFRLHEIAGRLRDGEISDRDKDAISDILWTLENTTFCPLGKFAAVAMRDVVGKGVVRL